MPDIFADRNIGLSSPLIGGFSITPADNLDLPMVSRQLRVTGSGGNIALIWQGGDETIEPVSAGDILDWRIRRVKATGTTATGLRGYY